MSALLLPGCATWWPRSVPDSPPSSWIWPLPNDYREVSSNYGGRVHPVTGGRRMHMGVDIRAPKNTPIYATADGEVVCSGRQSGYGNVIIIDHGGGVETLYAHLSRRKVREGKWVSQGRMIGKVGKTGNATGYHLHYEIRRNGKAVDPAPYLPR